MRAFMAVALGLAAGISAFAIAMGLLGSLAIAFVAGGAVAALAAWGAWIRPPVPLAANAVPRRLLILSATATVVTLVQLAVLTVFMVAPEQVAYSMVPDSGWEVRHSCLSAYFVAGEAVGRGGDAYDEGLYTAAGDTGVGVRKARMLGPFGIDVYEYPPPFLLVPRALRLLTTDFSRTRALWFGLNVAVILLAMLAVARRMGPVFATRAILLLPMALVGMSMLNTLQKGNIQPVVIALAMVAMAWFERRRWAGGAVLLAYSILAKLYPGMLGVYLLARRQWRAAAWTAAMGVVLLAASVADTGTAPFASFLHFLPGVLSGEAFPAFRNPGAIAINLSVPGLAFKAGLFGVPGMGFGAAKVLGWLYTAVIVFVTVRVGQRTQADAEKPLVWLAILILATMRSPFLPQGYGVVPALWLLTLLAATYAPTGKTLALVVVTAVALNLHWPLDWPMDPRLRAVLYTIPQAITIGIAVLALRRRVGAPEGDTLTV